MSIEARIIRIEVDKAALNPEVTNFEDIAPAASVRDAGAPVAVAMDAGAGALAGEDV